MELAKRIEETEKNIDTTAELFYQQKNQMAYTELEKVIVDLSQIIEEAYRKNQGNEEVMSRINDLTIVLQDVVVSLEDKDSVLIADLLKYEITEKLSALQL